MSGLCCTKKNYCAVRKTFQVLDSNWIYRFLNLIKGCTVILLTATKFARDCDLSNLACCVIFGLKEIFVNDPPPPPIKKILLASKGVKIDPKTVFEDHNL